MSADPSPPQHSAEYWIQHLGLVKSPGGGYFRQVTRSTHEVDSKQGNRRLAYTTIYSLSTPENPSRLHRLCSDELWFYHAGDARQVHVILRDAEDEDRICVPPRAAPADPAASGPEYQVYRCVTVGPRVDAGEVLQYTVPGGAILGSSVAAADGTEKKYGYSLVSCVVSPGFDVADTQPFTQAQLMELCPQHEEVIKKMAYESIP